MDETPVDILLCRAPDLNDFQGPLAPARQQQVTGFPAKNPVSNLSLTGTSAPDRYYRDVPCYFLAVSRACCLGMPGGIQ